MIRDRTDQMLKRATDKLMNGIESAMARHADVLRYLVDTPVDVDARGRVIRRSKPGEYPRLETGQLQNNIAWGIDREGLEGRVGVKGYGTDEQFLHADRPKRPYSWGPADENIGGLALVWLEEFGDRRGIKASYELRDMFIAREIIEGAEG